MHGRGFLFDNEKLTDVVDGDAGENALTLARVARKKNAVLETIMLI